MDVRAWESVSGAQDGLVQEQVVVTLLLIATFQELTDGDRPHRCAAAHVGVRM